MLSHWHCREYPDEDYVAAKDFKSAFRILRCRECPAWKPSTCTGPVKGKDLPAPEIQRVVVDEILAERERQDGLYGEQNHEPFTWLGILGEEFGELCEAVSETSLPGRHPDRGGVKNMRREAIHVAAVAVSFVEYLERTK